MYKLCFTYLIKYIFNVNSLYFSLNPSTLLKNMLETKGIRKLQRLNYVNTVKQKKAHKKSTL